MFKSALALALLALSTNLFANCVGSGSFQSCMDSSGNSYTVQRLGNTTLLNGTAANGNTWSQTSQSMGNTTFHNGTAANGNSWNGTTQSIGNRQFYNGTDSRGRSYSGSCTTIGNQRICN